MKSLLFFILMLIMATEINAKIKPDGCFTFGIMTANAAMYPVFTLNGGVRIPITKIFSVAGGVGTDLYLHTTKELMEQALRTGSNYYAYGAISITKKVMKPLLFVQLGLSQFNGKEGKIDNSFTSPYASIGTGFNLMSNKRHAGMAVRLQYYINTSVPKSGVLFGVGFCF